MSSGFGSPGRCSRWTKNSRFPFGPGSPESTTPTVTASHARAASMTVSTTFRCTSGSRTTPLATSLRPASNCGLTRTSASQPGHGEPEDRPERLRHADERDVADDELGRERQLGERAGVHALEHGHARIRAKTWVELPVADVDRDDPRRAGLEQAVREPARRRADVRAIAPGDVARRTRRARSGASPLRERRSAEAAPPRASASSATCSPGLLWPRTRPASTSACACDRDSASPRSTSRTSRRFFVMKEPGSPSGPS